MKTRILMGWRWILTVSGTVMLLGCLDQHNKTGAQTIVESNATVSTTGSPSSASDTPTETLPERAIIPPANLSPGLAEVVKLAQSGVSEQVLLAYVQESNHAFSPTVDEIVYLKDIGISDSVVEALVRRHSATNEVAQVAPNPEVIENKSASEQSISNGPSLIDPNAPSYSVSAETNYGEAAVSPAQEVNINYFESALAPYGSWVDVPDYGRCWQPTVVVLNRNWRPYADRGRWLYTSHGWYWQSDYSWGWAPFHYGRWHCDNRIGWVWVPGSTWGPAWVSWRYTDDYCGWAPLPPSARYVSGFGFYYRNSRVGIGFDFGLRDDCYTFIPTSRFCERSPSRYYVWGSHARPIYHKSVVINNYVRGNNNTIVNEGVGRERITRATHTPIRTVSLRELPTGSNPAGRAERLEGNNLTVFRPNVSTVNSGRTMTQRSLTSTPPSQKPESLSPSLRSIPRTREGSTAVTPPVTPTVAPIDPLPEPPKTEPRKPLPSIATRNPSTRASAPNQINASASRPAPRSIVTSRPTPVPETRGLPGRVTPQEINRSVERREVTVVPKESPRAIERSSAPITSRPPITREMQSTPVVRTAPSVPQIQQPSVREIRRPEAPTFNPGQQRSLRSITPSPSAPAPVQNFSPSREINRGSVRVERSAPPQLSQPQPRPSVPAPSVRHSTPRQEAPASRIERSVGGRSERRS